MVGKEEGEANTGTVWMAALAGRVAEGWAAPAPPQVGRARLPSSAAPYPRLRVWGGPPCRPRIKVLMVTPGPWQRVG